MGLVEGMQEGGVQGAYRNVGLVGEGIQEGGSCRVHTDKCTMQICNEYLTEQQSVYNHKVKQYSRHVLYHVRIFTCCNLSISEVFFCIRTEKP